MKEPSCLEREPYCGRLLGKEVEGLVLDMPSMTLGWKGHEAVLMDQYQGELVEPLLT